MVPKPAKTRFVSVDTAEQEDEHDWVNECEERCERIAEIEFPFSPGEHPEAAHCLPPHPR